MNAQNTTNRIKQWSKQQGHRRFIVYLSGLFTWLSLMACWLTYIRHHPETHNPATCIGTAIATVAFFVGWAGVCFRFKKTGIGVLAVTVWLGLFCAMPHTGHAAQTGTAQIQTADTGPQIAAQPKVQTPSCVALYLAMLLIVLGVALWMIWAVCKASGQCGKTGKQPPVTPGSGAQANVVTKTVFSSVSTNLPVTIFYLVNGQVISNSADLTLSVLPPLINSNGVAIPSGSKLLDYNAPPGITASPSLGLWTETNSYSDANLDPSHPYQIVMNYSLLTSTNFLDWQEVYTALTWVNSNVQTPLAASIFYTNGIPATTNWMQLFLDQTQTPTNIVVYGQLMAMPTNTAPAVVPHGLPIPGGGGGGTGTNAVPSQTSIIYYRMVCNTNQIVTQWP